ncbi:hypothetical protein BD770DRAFT_407066 [Pilaira anomala]|nr:hypothetical protein BD770DRAFT_407066 [Pilaira anomala]
MIIAFLKEKKKEDGSTSLGKRKRKAAVPDQGLTRKRQATSGKPDELSEHDRRNIIRAVLKYGDLEARYDDSVTDFDLRQKDKETVLNLYHDLLQECRARVHEQVEASNSSLKGIELSEEILLRESRHKKQKAILFTWHDIQNVNAGQIFQRHQDMKILSKRLRSVNDKYKFRVPTEDKQVQDWSCNWGAREDGMLLFGVYVHGFGSWLDIKADTTLGLRDKMFVGENDSDEKKVPKATNLDINEKVAFLPVIDTSNYLSPENIFMREEQLRSINQYSHDFQHSNIRSYKISMIVITSYLNVD